MFQKKNIFYYKRTKKRRFKVLKIISDYFNDDFKLISTEEISPKKSEDIKDIRLCHNVLLYDRFEVEFVIGEDSLEYIMMFYEDPAGYKLRYSDAIPFINTPYIVGDFDDYLEKSFNTTDENIIFLVEQLDIFLKSIIECKENFKDKNHFEIAFKLVCEKRGLDYEKVFNKYFEKQ